MNQSQTNKLETVPLFNGQHGVRTLLETTVREAPSDSKLSLAVRKDLNAQPLLDFVCSNATLDRYREIIEPSGWRLDNYRRNPVFQNSHNYGDVIFTLGKAVLTEVREGALYQRVQFATEINPMARIAHGLYQGGFLRAVSVGFLPVRWENGGANSDFRRKYLEQELLEVSAVAIPANPDALVLGLKSGAVAKADLQDAAELLKVLLKTVAPTDSQLSTPPRTPAAARHAQSLSATQPDRPACCRSAQNPRPMNEPNPEMQTLLNDIQTGWSAVSALPGQVQALEDQSAKLRNELTEVRRVLAARPGPSPAAHPGRVSDECARHLAATFIAHCERSGKLEALCSLPAQRDALASFARGELSLATRAALTTGDIPLPTHYGGEIRELISQFGVARKQMMPYPIGMGTARPARMGTRPAFSSIAMSAAFSEKVPTITFASLESHKIGGIVRLPREIDEQSIVAMGQFLARYGAIEFARAEDTWAFLADGSGSYENVKGIVKVARDNAHTLSLAAGKTKPSDATLDDFRALRRSVNKAALHGRLSAYYLDSTWETRLPAFRTNAEPNVYQRLPNGNALLDGYPIVWTDVLTPYGTAAAAADEPLAVFGALSFWWFGEHGTPRIDTSEHVWFVNDQLAVRFIEEIDFDYAAVDSTAALLAAAA